MENIHQGHRTRLREVAEQSGLDKLKQHQVLELLLTYVIPQKDVNPIAHNLINQFGSFSAVLDASKTDLLKVKGIGEKTAQFLSTFKEFFYLYESKRNQNLSTVKNTKEAVSYISGVFKNKTIEEMYVLCIDGVNNIKKFEQVSKGVSNATSVNIRKITEIILSSNTHNVIVCHNHPDGDSESSASDDRFTRALQMSLSINNINLLDHIIIGTNDSFYSYNLSGKLKTYNDELKNLINNQMLMQNACPYN